MSVKLNLIVGEGECSFLRVEQAFRRCSSIGILYENISMFGRHLELPEEVIKGIEAGLRVTMTCADALHQLLTNWKSTESSKASLEALVGCLRSCDLNDCADELLEEFKMRRNYSRGKFIEVPVVVQTFLSSADLHLLVLTTRDAILTIEKIEDNYQERMPLLGFATEDEILSGKIDLIMAHSAPIMVHIKSRILEVIGALSKLRAKAILVAEDESVSLTEKLDLEQLPGLILGDDQQRWTDLNPYFQTEILTRPIYGTISWAAVLQNVESTGDSDRCSMMVDEKILIELIRNKRPNLFEHLLPPPIKYYVERRLVPRHVVDARIFETARPNSTFLFTGLSLRQLYGFVKNLAVDSSTNQLQQSGVPCRFVTLDMKSHFDKFAAKTDHPVHWIHYSEENNRFIWLKSKGAMDDLHSAITEKRDAEPLGMEEFIAYLESSSVLTDIKDAMPVVISDSPGMRKSIILLHLARKLAADYPERVVLLLPINDAVTALKTELQETSINRAAVILTLTHAACQTELQVKVMQSAIKNESARIELLLDGFDELIEDDYPLGFALLTTIINEFKATIRPWVTSRPHLLHQLESTLQVLGYEIVPFGNEDQTKFLTTYWALHHHQLSRDPLDKVKLAQFSQQCLSNLKRNMGSGEEDFAGIPLQCLLIAEVFQDDASNYATPNNLITSCSDNNILDNYHYSITDLYQQVILKKLAMFKKRNKSHEDLDELSFINIHVHLSLCLIFPRWASLFKTELEINDAVATVVALNAGLVESQTPG